MLITALLSCALLSALPATHGAQVGMPPLAGIRRLGQALFPELTGQYAQAQGCLGAGYSLAINQLPCSNPSVPFLIPAWGVGCMKEEVFLPPALPAPGLGFQTPLRRTKVELAEEDLLPEAEALAEVTVRGTGKPGRSLEGASFSPLPSRSPDQRQHCGPLLPHAVVPGPSP